MSGPVTSRTAQQMLRTDATNSDFRSLVRSLDAYLAEMDGKEHGFYAQYNAVNTIPHVVVLFHEGIPCACGAMKPFDADAMEVKRMYTIPEARGKGFGSLVLKELERWAAELSIARCVLETGKRQTEAVALYRKNGYTIIPNYGQYIGVDNSICFERHLR